MKTTENEQPERPAYYAVIPAPILYDDRLPPKAILLYGALTALAHQEGYCWASNQYLAERFHADIRTIQRWISFLKAKGYIQVEDAHSGKYRKIFITESFSKLSTTHGKNATHTRQKCHPHMAEVPPTHGENATFNNTNIITFKKKQQQENTVVVEDNSYLQHAKQLLIEAGIIPRTADSLVTLPDFPDEQRLQCYLREAKTKRKPAGYLVSAIREHYSVDESHKENTPSYWPGVKDEVERLNKCFGI